MNTEPKTIVVNWNDIPQDGLLHNALKIVQYRRVLPLEIINSTSISQLVVQLVLHRVGNQQVKIIRPSG